LTKYWEGQNVRAFWDSESSVWDKVTREWVKVEEREAIIVLKKVGVAHVGTMINCGCGNCRLEPYWAKKTSQVISVDVSIQLLRRAKQRIKSSKNKNVHLILADISRLPLRSHVGDGLLCLGVLRHLPSKYGYKVVGESIRVIKEGGKLYFNDIPNLVHVEAMIYAVGKIIYTKLLRKNVKGVFHYSPYCLKKQISNKLVNIKFFGFNCRILPIHLCTHFLPKFKKLNRWFHTSPISQECISTKSEGLKLRILQYCTIEFVGQKASECLNS
jgi:ubiquinone/menaquinone biosynthesis C-methylase UbiE